VFSSSGCPVAVRFLVAVLAGLVVVAFQVELLAAPVAVAFQAELSAAPVAVVKSSGGSEADLRPRSG